MKRVYGDWTTAQLGGWKTAASEHVIQPMQQFDHTRGKNSTDTGWRDALSPAWTPGAAQRPSWGRIAETFDDP
ncbi:hypothetical protein ACVJ1F_001374 [Frigoribacterium sp. 2355]